MLTAHPSSALAHPILTPSHLLFLCPFLPHPRAFCLKAVGFQAISLSPAAVSTFIPEYITAIALPICSSLLLPSRHRVWSLCWAGCSHQDWDQCSVPVLRSVLAAVGASGVCSEPKRAQGWHRHCCSSHMFSVPPESPRSSRLGASEDTEPLKQGPRKLGAWGICVHPRTDCCAELSRTALTCPGWILADGSPQHLSRQHLKMSRGLRLALQMCSCLRSVPRAPCRH